ncbi:MAG: type II toxin-antitoxin system RatA family toxin [Gammaproteobacteria bacterium]|nr:type II toxin-antitoxin system RatA family toxin [Gammaproteobacteria bacterium]
MYRVNRSALLNYSARQMYDLVVDIEHYPEFLNWCSETRILERTESEVVASIEIRFKGLHRSFTTRNRMDDGRSVRIELVDGPFRTLNGIWRFVELDEHASKIELDLEFDFSSVFLARIVGPVFSQIANRQLDAFQRRAAQVYG